MKPSREKALNAEVRASRWLADANEAREQGKLEKAEKLYAKAQYWLDVMNRNLGRA